MADETPESLIPYDEIVQEALRDVVGRVLSSIEAGGSLPGTDYERSKAYTNYIRRLQAGQSGFTCFASLQMPRA